MELKVTNFDIDADGVATVRFDRPGRGNSWTSRMNAEYRYIMNRLDQDPAVKVIVLNGACAGIAVALASFCDLRYGAAGAKFTTSAPRLGLPAEYGLAWVLPRLMGVTHAADVLLTGRIFLAEEAKQMGYLNDVFPRDEFQERVAAIARSIATTVSPLSARATKRQLYGELMELDVGECIEDSKRLIAELMKSDDFKEGVAAQTERRPARFKGLGPERKTVKEGGAA